MHALQTERARIQARIGHSKKAIRQIRIQLGMDAAALAKVEQQLQDAGIVFERRAVRPELTDPTPE
jgi:hypothetical protein